MGDFYEVFYEDAKIASKLCDLTLTSRDKNSSNPIPMAGVPYHSAEKYIAKLVAHGYKVAVAEQMSEAKAGQIVERQVTAIITPGTYIQESQKQYSYIAGIAYSGGDLQNYHVAWGDFSVGQYRTQSFGAIEELLKFLLVLSPSEIVIDIDFAEKQEVEKYMSNFSHCLISTYDQPAGVDELLQNILGVQSLSSFGKALEDGRKLVFSLLVNYLRSVQKSSIHTISSVAYDNSSDAVLLDNVTMKNLELFSSHYDGAKKYSLLGVTDYTKTALGARLFREMLTRPTKNISTISRRQEQIEHYIAHRDDAEKISQTLSHMLDIPKIVSLILYKKHAPTTLGKLRYALSLAEQIKEPLLTLGVEENVITRCVELFQYLKNLLKEEGLNDEIDYICDGFDAEIDELRKIAYHSDELLIAYQQEVAASSKVANVKVKYISNQWYFLEVTPKDISAFEAAAVKGDPKFDFIRRQTLKTGERYITPYLEELQHKILAAQFHLKTKEQALLLIAKEKVIEAVRALTALSDGIAWLDIFVMHALFATAKWWIKPQVQNQWVLEITWGRHPVIEEYLPIDQKFIANDLQIWSGESTLHIITGPNMGGKSTYLRQNALIILLAQCGLYVPAKKAVIPVVDWLFARVGSGDVIAKNQSTFMTEMIEMANILHNATSKSFIILDELGRGTSTYDGLALAQAIVQYIAEKIGAKTLFATHYHELISLEWQLPWVKNYSVSVYETDKEVVFMKKIVAGGASKSYWLDVAKIAGIPKLITDQAKKYLDHLEQTKTKEQWIKVEWLFGGVDFEAIETKTKYDKLKRILNDIDPNNVTPLQALQLLGKLRDEVGK